MAPNRSYYQYYTFCGFKIFYLRVKILLYINKLLCYWCGVVDGDFYSKRYLNISAKFHTSMFGYQHSICTFMCVDMFSLKKFLVSWYVLFEKIPGLVVDVDDGEIEVKCLHKNGHNRFFWPRIEDKIWYSMDQYFSQLSRFLYILFLVTNEILYFKAPKCWAFFVMVRFHNFVL